MPHWYCRLKALAGAPGTSQISLCLWTTEGEAAMNCDEYRKRRILAEGETNFPDDVRVHLEECEECQIYLREQERLRIEVRKLAEREHAPEELRESVADILRE